MNFRAQFACIAGCEGRYPLDEVIYRCPSCGALLEVAHDMSELSKTSASDWKTKFDARYRAISGSLDSGVWGKKEWVCPELRDENIVSLGEGSSHLWHAVRYGQAIGVPRVRIKQCGHTHTGSFKDLGMTVLVSMVNQMIRDGKPIRAIACASTGDTSAALAAYCAAAAIRAVVLLPKGKISTAQLAQPLSSGAVVCAIDTDFDGCMEHVQKLAMEPGVYLANSMNSLRLEGQKTVAIEMTQQLGWRAPDWVIIPGGNLGNVSALGAGFSMMRALGLIDRFPRICVAQAAAANPLYQAFVDGWDRFKPIEAQPTEASAIRIGNPVSIARAIATLKKFDGVVEQATESELAEAAALADKHGAYACPHTGVALAALEKLVAKNLVRAEHDVVVVSTASGLKFTDFKVRYHEGGIAKAAVHKNAPISVEHRYTSVRDAVLGHL